MDLDTSIKFSLLAGIRIYWLVHQLVPKPLKDYHIKKISLKLMPPSNI